MIIKRKLYSAGWFRKGGRKVVENVIDPLRRSFGGLVSKNSLENRAINDAITEKSKKKINEIAKYLPGNKHQIKPMVKAGVEKAEGYIASKSVGGHVADLVEATAKDPVSVGLVAAPIPGTSVFIPAAKKVANGVTLGGYGKVTEGAGKTLHRPYKKTAASGRYILDRHILRKSKGQAMRGAVKTKQSVEKFTGNYSPKDTIKDVVDNVVGLTTGVKA